MYAQISIPLFLFLFATKIKLFGNRKRGCMIKIYVLLCTLEFLPADFLFHLYKKSSYKKYQIITKPVARGKLLNE